MIDEKKLIEALRASQNTGRETFPVDLIIEVIEEQPRAEKWILCNERLPDDDSDYLLLQESGDYHIGYWRPDAASWDNSYYGWIYEDIVAWQPLPPEPHKE